MTFHFRAISLDNAVTETSRLLISFLLIVFSGTLLLCGLGVSDRIGNQWMSHNHENDPGSGSSSDIHCGDFSI